MSFQGPPLEADLSLEPEPEDNPNQPSLLGGIVRRAPRLERTNEAPYPAPPPANRAGELQALRDEIGECHRCALWPGRSCLVFGAGSAEALVMVVGGGPGAEEDAAGEPFLGAGGEMLTRILENVLGLTREQVYLTDAVKCRPPAGRTATVEEAGICQPFILRQVEVVRPRLIITMGRLATWAILETSQPLHKLRGHWFTYRGIPVMPTFHPNEILQDPSRKRPVFEDMKAVRSRLDQLAG